MRRNEAMIRLNSMPKESGAGGRTQPGSRYATGRMDRRHLRQCRGPVCFAFKESENAGWDDQPEVRDLSIWSERVGRMEGPPELPGLIAASV